MGTKAAGGGNPSGAGRCRLGGVALGGATEGAAASFFVGTVEVGGLARGRPGSRSTFSCGLRKLPHAHLTVDVGGGLASDRSGSSSRFLGEAGGEGRGDDVEETGFPLRRPPKEVIVRLVDKGRKTT